MGDVRLVLLAGDDRRHRYAATRLAAGATLELGTKTPVAALEATA